MVPVLYSLKLGQSYRTLLTAGQFSSQIFYLSDLNRQSCYLAPVERKQK